MDLSLELLRRAFAVLRYGNGVRADVLESFARLAGDMAREIPATLPARRAEREALYRVMVRRWQAQTDGAFAEIQARLDRELPEVAGAFRHAAAVDLGTEPVSAVSRAPGEVEGLPVSQWLGAQRRELVMRAEARVRAGAGRGEDAGTIAASVENAVASAGRRAATVAKTAATKAANTGYAQGMGDAGVERYVWVAVLDDRTTDICRGLNGQTFPVGDPDAPKPPAHWNCRSHIEPVRSGGDDAGMSDILRGAGLDVEAVREAERQLIGTGAMSAPAQGWARNPAAAVAARLRAEAIPVRQAILGRVAARRFGVGLTLAQVARRDTGTLTLAELMLRVRP